VAWRASARPAGADRIGFAGGRGHSPVDNPPRSTAHRRRASTIQIRHHCTPTCARRAQAARSRRCSRKEPGAMLAHARMVYVPIFDACVSEAAGVRRRVPACARGGARGCWCTIMQAHACTAREPFARVPRHCRAGLPTLRIEARRWPMPRSARPRTCPRVVQAARPRVREWPRHTPRSPAAAGLLRL
jgi:hypothetical protein